MHPLPQTGRGFGFLCNTNKKHFNMASNYMVSKIEQLRELVAKGKEHGEVSAMTIYKELTFIEKRHLEEYFLVAHQLVSNLKRDKDIIIGPGWGRMINSHVCYSLGITNINPVEIDVEPILIWGDDKRNLTVNIEVDEESYYRVYQKAIELFGFENVARMPVMDDKNPHLNDHEYIGTKANGEKVYLHACALLICLDGVEKHFDVDEVTDERDNKILCVKDYVEECDNQTTLRYNILQSSILTRIKGIQKQIEKNGKEYSKMYERPISKEDYQLFHNGDLDDIPDFGSHHIQKLTKLLMKKRTQDVFAELLNIQGLYIVEKWYALSDKNSLITEEMIAEYKKKHLLPPFQNQLPYGILFAEDAAWLLHYWTGLTWKQTAELLQYVFEKKEKEAEPLVGLSIYQGRDNGFKNDDIYRILHSLFNRPLIRSKAHYAGRLYLSVYLAGLKHKYFYTDYEIKSNNKD